MSSRERYILCSAVVVAPWALPVVLIAAENPRAAVVALSPAALVLVLLGSVGLAASIGIALLGTALLILLTVRVTRGREWMLLPIGWCIFFAGCYFTFLMKQ